MGRKRMYKPKICPVCGRRYNPKAYYTTFCSYKCAVAGRARPERYAGERTEPISMEALAHARTKPASCSDVRWRIELSRRRLQKNYNECVYCLPDPDRLT